MILFCFWIFGLSGQKQYLYRINTNTFKHMMENLVNYLTKEGGGMPSPETIKSTYRIRIVSNYLFLIVQKSPVILSQ